jgi:cytosine/adenosine deaminase-related metal-dependent hydrolase
MFCICCRVPNQSRSGFFAEAAGEASPDIAAALARRALYLKRATFSAAPAAHPAQTEFIIRDAHVITLDPKTGDLQHADIHVRDGMIVDVGHDLQATALHEIDGRGRIALPGFVAGHRHLCSEALARRDAAANDPAPLMAAGAAEIYRMVRLALLDAICAGITTVHHCSSDIGGGHADTAILAAIDSGARGRFSYPLDAPQASAAQQDRNALARIKRDWFGPHSDRLLDLGITLTGDGDDGSGRDADRMATLDAARALDLDHCVGSLTPGKRADLILIEAPRHNDNAPAEIIRRATPAEISLVAIDGRLRKRNGVLTEPNEGLIRREGEQAMARVGATAVVG